MKLMTLVTTLIVTASSYSYAGHLKNIDVQQDKDAHEVTVSTGTSINEVQSVITNGNRAATQERGTEFNHQYHDVYDAYQDLDANLGS